MLVSLLGSVIFFVLIYLLPVFLVLPVLVVTFVAGFLLIYLEIDHSPDDSTWRSTIGAIMTTSPILIGVLCIILVPNNYTVY